MDQKSRVRMRLAIVCSLVVLYIVLLGIPGYLLFLDPIPFEEVFTGPYAASTPVEGWGAAPPETPGRVGDIVYVHREFCLSRSVKGGVIRRWLRERSTRSIVFVYPLEAIPDDMLVGGCRVINVATEIPGVPPGVYVQDAQWQFQINPLRTAAVNLTPVEIFVSGGNLSNHKSEDNRRFLSIGQALESLRVRDRDLEFNILSLQKGLSEHRQMTERSTKSPVYPSQHGTLPSRPVIPINPNPSGK